MKKIRAAGGSLTPEDLRQTTTERERRGKERIAHERMISILPVTSKPTWEFVDVRMFDCSHNGMGFTSDRVFARGEEFLAKLKTFRMVMILYQVRHSTPLANGRFKIGANLVEFVGTPKEILDALLADDDGGSASGR